jgi:UDP-N-acetyl-D-galactosamine dehydrogenase
MVSFAEIEKGHAKIAIVGLGYVGLPLAAAFGRQAPVIGFYVSLFGGFYENLMF